MDKSAISTNFNESQFLNITNFGMRFSKKRHFSKITPECPISENTILTDQEKKTVLTPKVPKPVKEEIKFTVRNVNKDNENKVTETQEQEIARLLLLEYNRLSKMIARLKNTLRETVPRVLNNIIKYIEKNKLKECQPRKLNRVTDYFKKENIILHTDYSYITKMINIYLALMDTLIEYSYVYEKSLNNESELGSCIFYYYSQRFIIDLSDTILSKIKDIIEYLGTSNNRKISFKNIDNITNRKKEKILYSIYECFTIFQKKILSEPKVQLPILLNNNIMNELNLLRQKDFNKENELRNTLMSNPLYLKSQLNSNIGWNKIKKKKIKVLAIESNALINIYKMHKKCQIVSRKYDYLFDYEVYRTDPIQLIKDFLNEDC